MRKKIREFLKNYQKNVDGNWLKKNSPTEGYLNQVVDLPGESNKAFNLLEELLK